MPGLGSQEGVGQGSRPAFAKRWRVGLLLVVAAIGVGGCGRGCGSGGSNGSGGGNLPAKDSKNYTDAVTAFHVGVAALDAGEDIRAQSKLASVTQLAPEEPAGWADLGLLSLRQNKLDEAATHLDKARALAPDNPAILLIAGLLEDRRGQFAKAIEYFQKVVQRDPGNIRARYALAKESEKQGGPTSDTDYKTQLDAILTVQPNNLAGLVDRARLAAKMKDSATLHSTLDVLAKRSADWPADVKAQLKEAQQSAAGTDDRTTGIKIQFLNNVLKQVAEYRSSYNELTWVESQVGTPLEKLVKLPDTPSAPVAPDTALTFAPEPLGTGTGKAAFAAALSLNGEGNPVVLAADGKTVHVGANIMLPFPGGNANLPPSPNAIAMADWNFDFQTDLAVAGGGGLKLYEQGSGGAFTDVTARAKLPDTVTKAPLYGVWAADIDLDGDLDLVVAPMSGPPVVLRNNTDGTFKAIQPFTGVSNVRAFAWADFDGDGDPDPAFIDAQGGLHIFANERSGQFTARQVPTLSGKPVALAVADLDNDGFMDLVVLLDNGAIARLADHSEGKSFDVVVVAQWTPVPAGMTPGTVTLLTADLDNNGALDLVASAGNTAQAWLQDGQGLFAPLAAPIAGRVFAAADMTGTGKLDLIGLSATGEATKFVNKGTKNYHWLTLRPKAKDNHTKGDQRINSFGIGGEVEVRAGLLVQKQSILSPVMHFGLGDKTMADALRIVWPNGSYQAEFEYQGDKAEIAEQRLKGSCPFLFAWDGKEMQFITDCIWRSPLGLKINAQETAGVAQTEDWVKVRGDQLAARDGFYDLSITAELWETHFFDLTSLLVVDHPVGTDIFVDERFAIPPPPHQVYTVSTPRPIAHATDDSGNDVTQLLSARDGTHLDNFGRGDYQGITRDHWVEVELPEDAPMSGPLWLVAYGWIHPTDSSINVAISQGKHDPPKGLSLEVADGRGGWKVAKPGLGFPEGKVKTILVNLEGVFPPNAPRRLRLRTNLEIYWDCIQWAQGLPHAPTKIKRLELSSAELRYRGFSVVKAADASSPELPQNYDQLTSTKQLWRDLVGYCTRFGDVKELLTKVDDRYVILNAGDEMRLKFPAQPPPPNGWTRDYVLIGDGWEKDGDYNTTFSKTVLPLPAHAITSYITPPRGLKNDPVYQKHRQDWQTYHTRYVTPDQFNRGLRPN